MPEICVIRAMLAHSRSQAGIFSTARRLRTNRSWSRSRLGIRAVRIVGKAPPVQHWRPHAIRKRRFRQEHEALRSEYLASSFEWQTRTESRQDVSWKDYRPISFLPVLGR